MNITKERQKTSYLALAKQFGYTSSMQCPHIEKIIVSTGVGKKRDKKVIETIKNRLTKITGQKPSPRPARMSIASFKVREGDIIGLQTTLRGARMYDFIDKLIHIAIPRTRDFRGLKATAIDEMGNLTIGIRENTIFPEMGDEDMRDVFSLAVTIVTNCKTKEEAEAFFRHIGMPLRVHKEKKKN